jgi:hypothetical protein
MATLWLEKAETINYGHEEDLGETFKSYILINTNLFFSFPL